MRQAVPALSPILRTETWHQVVNEPDEPEFTGRTMRLEVRLDGDGNEVIVGPLPIVQLLLKQAGFSFQETTFTDEGFQRAREGR